MNQNLKNNITRMLVTALGALSIFASAAALAAPVEAQGRAPAAAEVSGAMVDIQTASAAELESLPGVGPARAQAIIAYRTRTPFRRVEDILRVEGIGRATFRTMRGRLTVGGTRAAPDGEGAE
jgi:competence protein ComEA